MTYFPEEPEFPENINVFYRMIIMIIDKTWGFIVRH